MVAEKLYLLGGDSMVFYAFRRVMRVRQGIGSLGIVMVAAVIAGASACGTVTSSEGERALEDRAPTEPAPEPRGQITPIVRDPEPADPEPEEPPTLEERLSETRIACTRPVAVYQEGRRIGRVCPDVAPELGLTVVDLSDDWAPNIFSEAPELGDAGHQPYRRTYIALADERFDEAGLSPRSDQYLELYGIFPSFRVLRERLNEEERYRCHEAVDDSGLEALTTTLHPSYRQGSQLRRRIRQVRYLRHRLERARERQGLDSIGDLASDPDLGPLVERYERDRVYVEAVAAMQEHLQCEGYLGRRYSEGVFDGPTRGALRQYQRRHMIVSRDELDADTRELLTLDSHEADFRALLRSLRERVVDATGLIEDGSAAREWGTVLGRQLNSEAFRFDAGQPAAPNPAPDLISPSTEAAARALGWTSPRAATEFLNALGDGGTASLRVALPLPPLPEYHSDHMDLRAEIDRGDVYYELGNRMRRVDRRPINTLYVRHEGREIALMRWGTTIGGWQSENTEDGGVGLRYKESPVGERVWRDVVASPAWLPPESTPDEELLGRTRDGYAVQRALMGPGYRSAYGLVMMMHHEVLPSRDPDGEPRFRDEGIRSHGSVSYRSILGGFSHGCHRLYNHLAVRLAGFLLHHRRHIRHGSQSVDFGREFEHEGEAYSFHINSRGYLYELTPPVPIVVLEGNILGSRDEPARGFYNVRYPEPEEPGEEGAEGGAEVDEATAPPSSEAQDPANGDGEP